MFELSKSLNQLTTPLGKHNPDSPQKESLLLTPIKKASSEGALLSQDTINHHKQNATKINPINEMGFDLYILSFDGKRWLTPEEASLLTGLTTNTLRQYRHKRIGLPFYKVGDPPEDGKKDRRHARYLLKEVLDYMQSGRVEPVNR